MPRFTVERHSYRHQNNQQWQHCEHDHVQPLIELTNIQAVIVDCNVAGAIGIITCLGILSEPHDPERPPAHHPPQVVPPNPFELGSSHINQ